MTKRTKKVKVKSVKLPRSIKQMYPNVEFAYDASEPMEVTVNAKDCKEAQSMNPTDCALARAAKREMKADGVIIGMASSYVIHGNKAIRFATPVSVQREIVSFDRSHDFATGSYTLPPKPPTARFGESHDKRDKTGGKNKSARRVRHGSARVRVLARGSQGSR
jgi:hypothetical protein